MEFKNINNYRMKWFGVDEIRNLEEVKDKLPFIQKFSFGPFVPYNLYHFFHNFWDFYILELIIIGTITFLTLISFYIYYFFTIFKTFLQQDTVSIEDYSSHSLPIFLEVYGHSYIIWLIVILLLIFICVVVVKFYTGKHCRKLSWNRCEWKSYEDFEQGEKNWHIAGLVFFILYVLNVLLVLGLIIGGTFLLKLF